MFQQSVKVYSGVGQAGQPASNTPIIAAAGGPGAFQAGDNGLVMARFAWRDATNPVKLNNTGTGKP
ncbi:phage cement protein, partial [Escherichia coli]